MSTPLNNAQTPLNILGLPVTSPGTSMITDNPNFIEGAQSVGYSMAAGISHARALMADTDDELNLHRQAAEEMTRRATSLTNEASLANLWGNAGAQIAGTMLTGGAAGLGVRALGGAALSRLGAATAAGTALNAPASYNESINTQLAHDVPYKQALSDAIAPAAVNAGLDSVAPVMAIAKGLAGEAVQETGDSFLKQFGKTTAVEGLTGAAQSGVNTGFVDDAYQKYDVLSGKGLGEMAHAGMMEAVAGSPYLAAAAFAQSPRPTIAPEVSPPVQDPGSLEIVAPATGQSLGINDAPLSQDASSPTTVPTLSQARAARAAELLATAGNGAEFLNLKQLNDFTKTLVDELGGDQADKKALASQLMAEAKQDFEGKIAYSATAIAQGLESRLPIFAAGIEQKNQAIADKATNTFLTNTGVTTPSTGLTEDKVSKMFSGKKYEGPQLQDPNAPLLLTDYDSRKQMNENQEEIDRRFSVASTAEPTPVEPVSPGQTPNIEMFDLAGTPTTAAVNMKALPAPRVGMSDEQIAQAQQQLLAEQNPRLVQPVVQTPVLMRNQELDVGGDQAIPVPLSGGAMVDGFGVDPLRTANPANTPVSETTTTPPAHAWKTAPTVQTLVPKSKTSALHKAVMEANSIDEALAALDGLINGKGKGKGVTNQKATDISLALIKLRDGTAQQPTAAKVTPPQGLGGFLAAQMGVPLDSVAELTETETTLETTPATETAPVVAKTNPLDNLVALEYTDNTAPETVTPVQAAPTSQPAPAVQTAPVTEAAPAVQTALVSETAPAAQTALVTEAAPVEEDIPITGRVLPSTDFLPDGDLTDDMLPPAAIKVTSKGGGYKSATAAKAAANKLNKERNEQQVYRPVKLKDGSYGITSQQLLDDAKANPLKTLAKNVIPPNLVTRDGMGAEFTSKDLTVESWLGLVRTKFNDVAYTRMPLTLVNEIMNYLDNDFPDTFPKESQSERNGGDRVYNEVYGLVSEAIEDLAQIAREKAEGFGVEEDLKETTEEVKQPEQPNKPTPEAAPAKPTKKTKLSGNPSVKAALDKNALLPPGLKDMAKKAVDQKVGEKGSIENSLQKLLDEYEDHDNENAVPYIRGVIDAVRTAKGEQRIAEQKQLVERVGGSFEVKELSPEEFAQVQADLERSRAEKAANPNNVDKLEQIKREKKPDAVTPKGDAPLDSGDVRETNAPMFARKDTVIPSETVRGTPLSAKKVWDVIADIRSTFPGLPTVNLFRTLRDAPQEVYDYALKGSKNGGKDVHGFFYNGELYIIGDKLFTPLDVEAIILHEGHHFGLANAFGGDTFDFLNDIVNNLGGREGIRRMAATVGTDHLLPAYEGNYDAMVADGDISPAVANAKILEEAVMPLMESKSITAKRAVRMLLAKLANWTKRLGFPSITRLLERHTPNMLAVGLVLEAARKGLIAAGKGEGYYENGNTLPMFMLRSPQQAAQVVTNIAQRQARAITSLPYRNTIRKVAGYLSGKTGTGAMFSARQLVSSADGLLNGIASNFRNTGREALADQLDDMHKRLRAIAEKQDTLAAEYLYKATQALGGLSEQSAKKVWELFQLERDPRYVATVLNKEELTAYNGLRRTFDSFFDRVMRPAYEKEANLLLLDGKDTSSVMALSPGNGEYVVRGGQFVLVGKGKGTHNLVHYRKNYAPRIYDREKIKANQQQFVNDIAARANLTPDQAEKVYDDIMNDKTEVSQIGQAPKVGVGKKGVQKSRKIDIDLPNVGVGKTGFQKSRKIDLPNAVFEGYLSKDLGTVLPVYLNRTTQHALFTKEFGRMQTSVDGSLRLTKGNEWAEIHNALDNEDDRAVFRRIMNTVTGRTGLTDSTLARTTSAGLRAFSSTMMMSLILLKSLGDVAWIAAAGKNELMRSSARKALNEFAQSITNATKARSVEANRIFYQHAGLLTDAVMDRMLADQIDIASTEGWEGKFNRLTTKFYQRTGIHAFTNVLKGIALDAAMLAVNESIAILTNANTTAAEKQNATETLDRFGVDVNKWKLWEKAGRPTPQDAYDSGDAALYDATQAAVDVLAKFRNQHVAHPTQLDKTLWADNAIGKLFWQFHGYFYALQNNVMPAWFENIADGRIKDAAMQMLSYVPVAMVAGGAGLYAAHLAQFAAPAAFWGDPLSPHSLTGMDLGEAGLEVLKYTALSGFAAESWHTAVEMPGGFLDITNLAPAIGLATRTLDVDSITSAPMDMAGNIASLADNMFYAAFMWNVMPKIVAGVDDRVKNKRAALTNTP